MVILPICASLLISIDHVLLVAVSTRPTQDDEYPGLGGGDAG